MIDSQAALGALGRFNGLASNPKPLKPPNPTKVFTILIIFYNYVIFWYKY